MNWRAEAREAAIPHDKIEIVAKSIYHANWRELPNDRYPPVWESASEAVQNYVRNQAVRAIRTLSLVSDATDDRLGVVDGDGRQVTAQPHRE